MRESEQELFTTILLHKNLFTRFYTRCKMPCKMLTSFFFVTESRWWIKSSDNGAFMWKHSSPFWIRWTSFIISVASFWRTEFIMKSSLSKAWNCIPLRRVAFKKDRLNEFQMWKVSSRSLERNKRKFCPCICLWLEFRSETI